MFKQSQYHKTIDYGKCFKKLDQDTKEQVMPLLEAMLQAQPTIKMKSYAQTNISITMPKIRYEKLGRPQVGQVLRVDLQKFRDFLRF